MSKLSHVKGRHIGAETRIGSLAKFKDKWVEKHRSGDGRAIDLSSARTLGLIDGKLNIIRPGKAPKPAELKRQPNTVMESDGSVTYWLNPGALPLDVLDDEETVCRIPRSGLVVFAGTGMWTIFGAYINLAEFKNYTGRFVRTGAAVTLEVQNPESHFRQTVRVSFMLTNEHPRYTESAGGVIRVGPLTLHSNNGPQTADYQYLRLVRYWRLPDGTIEREVVSADDTKAQGRWIEFLMTDPADNPDVLPDFVRSLDWPHRESSEYDLGVYGQNLLNITPQGRKPLPSKPTQQGASAAAPVPQLADPVPQLADQVAQTLTMAMPVGASTGQVVNGMTGHPWPEFVGWGVDQPGPPWQAIYSPEYTTTLTAQAIARLVGPGFASVDVPARGNCFFVALLLAAGDHVRAWLLANPHLWQPSQTITHPDLSSRGSAGTTGGLTVLQAFRLAIGSALAQLVRDNDPEALSAIEGEGYLVGSATVESVLAVAAATRDRATPGAGTVAYVKGSYTTVGSVQVLLSALRQEADTVPVVVTGKHVSSVLDAVYGALNELADRFAGREPSWPETLHTIQQVAMDTATVLAGLPASGADADSVDSAAAEQTAVHLAGVLAGIGMLAGLARRAAGDEGRAVVDAVLADLVAQSARGHLSGPGLPGWTLLTQATERLRDRLLEPSLRLLTKVIASSGLWNNGRAEFGVIFGPRLANLRMVLVDDRYSGTQEYGDGTVVRLLRARNTAGHEHYRPLLLSTTNVPAPVNAGGSAAPVKSAKSARQPPGPPPNEVTRVLATIQLALRESTSGSTGSRTPGALLAETLAQTISQHSMFDFGRELWAKILHVDQQWPTDIATTGPARTGQSGTGQAGGGNFPGLGSASVDANAAWSRYQDADIECMLARAELAEFEAAHPDPDDSGATEYLAVLRSWADTARAELDAAILDVRSHGNDVTRLQQAHDWIVQAGVGKPFPLVAGNSGPKAGPRLVNWTNATRPAPGTTRPVPEIDRTRRYATATPSEVPAAGSALDWLWGSTRWLFGNQSLGETQPAAPDWASMLRAHVEDTAGRQDSAQLAALATAWPGMWEALSVLAATRRYSPAELHAAARDLIIAKHAVRRAGVNPQLLVTAYLDVHGLASLPAVPKPAALSLAPEVAGTDRPVRIPRKLIKPAPVPVSRLAKSADVRWRPDSRHATLRAYLLDCDLPKGVNRDFDRRSRSPMLVNWLREWVIGCLGVPGYTATRVARLSGDLFDSRQVFNWWATVDGFELLRRAPKSVLDWRGPTAEHPTLRDCINASRPDGTAPDQGGMFDSEVFEWAKEWAAGLARVKRSVKEKYKRKYITGKEVSELSGGLIGKKFIDDLWDGKMLPAITVDILFWRPDADLAGSPAESAVHEDLPRWRHQSGAQGGRVTVDGELCESLGALVRG